ncbi:unnamed protein product, partial [Amoebophrya sp. A25]
LTYSQVLVGCLGFVVLARVADTSTLFILRAVYLEIRTKLFRVTVKLNQDNEGRGSTSVSNASSTSKNANKAKPSQAARKRHPGTNKTGISSSQRRGASQTTNDAKDVDAETSSSTGDVATTTATTETDTTVDHAYGLHQWSSSSAGDEEATTPYKLITAAALEKKQRRSFLRTTLRLLRRIWTHIEYADGTVACIYQWLLDQWRSLVSRRGGPNSPEILKSKQQGSRVKHAPPTISEEDNSTGGTSELDRTETEAETAATRRRGEALAVDDVVEEHRLFCLRTAADLHRQARGKVAQMIAEHNESQQLTSEHVIQQLETCLAQAIREKGLQSRAGHAFPTGVCINEVAAHDSRTPCLSRKQYLQLSDVISLDFGVHVDGYLVDSAFSWTWDQPTHEPLLDTVREATYTGICEAGPDAWLQDVSFAIQEVMESGEVAWATGETFPVSCVMNLNGHQVGHGRIHAGKMLSSVVNGASSRMREGEQWAIETFG